MNVVLKPTAYNDIHTLSSAFSIAIGSGMLSREQASAAFKEQLYECGILKRPVVLPKPEEAKKTK